MIIKETDLSVFAKAYDILKCSMIVINDSFDVLYINNCARKSLKINGINSWLGINFIQLWKAAGLSPIIDEKFNFINNNVVTINERVKSWTKYSVTINNKVSWLLIDRDLTDIDNIYHLIQNTVSKIIGYKLDDNIPVEMYLYEMQHFLTNLLNRIPCYVYWKNKKLEYIGCNDLVVKFFQLNSAKEIVGKTDFDLFSNKKLAESYRKTDIKIFKSGKPVINLAQDLVNVNGEVFYTLVSKVPILNKQKSIVGILGITVDITKEKQAETAKTEFIANMSHDIRTPLTGVIGLSRILERDIVDPVQKQDAHLLAESGSQLLHMLNEILEDISIGGSSSSDVNSTSFDLYEAINTLIKLEAPTIATHNLKLTHFIAPDVPRYIISDKHKITHSLLNLLGNSIKFTKTGKIVIEVNVLGKTDKDVHLQFGVIDTGIGIPKALQDKIFDRFFKIDTSFKGVYSGYGLGLHIVKSYVNLLGGHITIASKEGSGTAIYFDLHCNIDNQSEILLQEKKSKGAAYKTSFIFQNTGHVLLIEDNLIALKILEDLSAKLGLLYASATDGQQAYQLAINGSFDLIITDLGLPLLSGQEFTKNFRKFEKKQSKKHVPIVGLTAHANDEIKKECKSLGMNAVFNKPITQESLRKIIEDYIFKKDNCITSPNVATTTLGLDLPATKEDLFAISSLAVLDIDSALQVLDNNKALYKDIVQTMVFEDLPRDLQEIEKVYAAKDWFEVERLVHRLKGGLTYIGTARLEKACLYLERYHKAGHRELLEELYQQFLTVFAETLLALKNFIASA